MGDFEHPPSDDFAPTRSEKIEALMVCIRETVHEIRQRVNQSILVLEQRFGEDNTALSQIKGLYDAVDLQNKIFNPEHFREVAIIAIEKYPEKDLGFLKPVVQQVIRAYFGVLDFG